MLYRLSYCGAEADRYRQGASGSSEVRCGARQAWSCCVPGTLPPRGPSGLRTARSGACAPVAPARARAGRGRRGRAPGGEWAGLRSGMIGGGWRSPPGSPAHRRAAPAPFRGPAAGLVVGAGWRARPRARSAGAFRRARPTRRGPGAAPARRRHQRRAAAALAPAAAATRAGGVSASGSTGRPSESSSSLIRIGTGGGRIACSGRSASGARSGSTRPPGGPAAARR